MDKKRITLIRICFAAFLAALVYLCFHSFSSLPVVRADFFGIPTDKLVHFVMFLPFPLLMFLSMRVDTSSKARTFLFIALSFILGCATGAATEFIQGITPSRTPDIKDFYADILGCLVSASISCLIFIRNGKKRK